MFIAIEGGEALERWAEMARSRQAVANRLWEITCCEVNVFNKSVFAEM